MYYQTWLPVMSQIWSANLNRNMDVTVLQARPTVYIEWTDGYLRFHCDHR